jgi:uncharacterized membrane protein
MRNDVVVAILAMAAAAFACRAGGFFLMRFVPITPRIEAGLRMIPIALVAAILSVAALKGGPPEWAGIVAALVAMAATRSDLAAIAAGVVCVAALRSML